MKWIKKGLLITSNFGLEWMTTHAMIPFADHISRDSYRVYFGGRNSRNMSQIGYVEFDINHIEKILNITSEPVVSLGSLGSFDDSGVFPHWIVTFEGKKYLYYTGWMQGLRVPYYASIGLAVSQDGGKTFTKISRAPILERNDIDPYMMHSPCVLIENGVWRMWYSSCVGWKENDDSPKPRYHIKYAESFDGINWKRDGSVCIDFKSSEEWAIARPCVLKEDIYKMWYSYRNDKFTVGGIGNYRIGYAESIDGIKWKRKDDQVGIDVSKSGWDSEMVGYAFVFKHNEGKYMLYNGNRYGKEGIGYAILDSKE